MIDYIQTFILLLAFLTAFWQVISTRATNATNEAQISYREYLAMAVEYPKWAFARAADTPAEKDQYVRFVTYALAACEKICDTVLSNQWIRLARPAEWQDWNSSIDKVIEIHREYLQETSLSPNALNEYSKALRDRIKAKFASVEIAADP